MKLAVLQTLTSPLSAMTHHSELASMKKLCSYPLMQAFYFDAIKWKHSAPAARYFSKETKKHCVRKGCEQVEWQSKHKQSYI